MQVRIKEVKRALKITWIFVIISVFGNYLDDQTYTFELNLVLFSQEKLKFEECRYQLWEVEQRAPTLVEHHT